MRIVTILRTHESNGGILTHASEITIFVLPFLILSYITCAVDTALLNVPEGTILTE